MVLDNNIFFSLMKPDSTNSYLFSALRAEFVAPEYIVSELNRHKSECLLKSKLSGHEFELRQAEVEGRITFFKSSAYKGFLKQASNALRDRKDSPYVAVALATESEIWSNDPHLKQQSLVEVHTTRELIDKLLKDEV